MIGYALAALALLFALSLTPVGVSFRRRMMARFYEKAQAKYDAHIADRKRRLFADIRGIVLEIGPGTGCNFEHLPDGVERWIGIEPNPHMHAQLRAAGEKRRIEAEFRTVSTEGMEVDDESVDVVLSTLVLCSVPDPAAVVRDVRRILKPGGRFVFVEHVAAPRGTSLRWVQRVLKPVWWYCADGCRLDRELATVLENAGFASVALDEFTVPTSVAPAVVSRQIAGVAVKG